jgi:hypothetical protein
MCVVELAQSLCVVELAQSLMLDQWLAGRAVWCVWSACVARFQSSACTPAGRPPLPPATAPSARLSQRRLVFSGNAVQLRRDTEAVAADLAAQATADLAAQATAAAGTGAAEQQQSRQGHAADDAWESHRPQGAGLALEEERFDGSVLSEDDARLLAGMPEELRRRSLDGVISLEALRVGKSGSMRACLSACERHLGFMSI